MKMRNQMQSPASMGGASAGPHKCLVGVAPQTPLAVGKPTFCARFAGREEADQMVGVRDFCWSLYSPLKYSFRRSDGCSRPRFSFAKELRSAFGF